MKQRILVEGADIHLILHLCMARGFKGLLKGFADEDEAKRDFLLNREKLGKKQVLTSISAAVKDPDITNLGIVVDADDSAESTWQSVRDALEKTGYTDLPAKPEPNGLILQSNSSLPYLQKRIGVWIMPDNEGPRAIEDLFLQLISEENYHLQRAKTVVAELIAEGQNLFSKTSSNKAETHTWLAWQEEPGKSMGLAIKSNWVNTEHPLAARFAAWFSQLFELENG